MKNAYSRTNTRINAHSQNEPCFSASVHWTSWQPEEEIFVMYRTVQRRLFCSVALISCFCSLWPCICFYSGASFSASLCFPSPLWRCIPSFCERILAASMSAYFEAHFHCAIAIDVCHQPWESGKPLGADADAPWTSVVSFLDTDGRWWWRCYRFTFTETRLWTLLLHTPNERKDNKPVFLPFLFPTHLPSLVQCRQKSQCEKTNWPIGKQWWTINQSDKKSKKKVQPYMRIKRLHLFHRHPDSTLHWLDLQCVYRRGVWGHGWGGSSQLVLSHQWAINWCSAILRTVTQWCGLNAYGTWKMQQLRKILQGTRPLNMNCKVHVFLSCPL